MICVTWDHVPLVLADLDRFPAGTPVARSRDEQDFATPVGITSGPYRYVRHPFYVTAALAFAANALATANWFIASTGFVALALLVIRTPTEEGKLVERFGDDYRRYMARTGRFFPRLRSAPPAAA